MGYNLTQRCKTTTDGLMQGTLNCSSKLCSPSHPLSEKSGVLWSCDIVVADGKVAKEVSR